MDDPINWQCRCWRNWL